MKAVSRLASPAGFALVLMLFLFLPFLSVSCDVPGVGSIGADYTGAHLATGTDPDVEIPAGLEDMRGELPGPDGSGEPPPDPGVRVLAIVVALVLVAGVALPFVPRLAGQVRRRMFGGAALAAAAGVLLVVAQAVAQANLTSRLTGDAERLSGGDEQAPSGDDIADGLIHSGVGLWLSLVLLVLIALASVGYVYKDKVFARPAPTRAVVGTSPPIWRAEPDEPDEPLAPTEPPAPAGPHAPPEPPAPTAPEGLHEPPAPAEPRTPREPPAPIEPPD